PSAFEEDVKKSRFLARAAAAHSPEEARAFLEAVREPGATHNCWAWRIGDACRSSDDGEPGGTAGRPILAALDAQGLDHVAVSVARWFGGIKLGAGGLARAYGGAAARCLRDAERRELRPLRKVLLEAGFAHVSPLYGVLERVGVRRLGEERWTGEGVAWDLAVEPERLDALRRAVADVTHGAGRVILCLRGGDP
ncbi:MAG: YigZ family protein, partial [Deltaproteobacteria bacterium]|nr:YigZ family protein [Deltaproteobacteria bacterium]